MDIDISYIKREINHCKFNIKLINHYLKNPKEIKELNKIKDTNDLLNLKEEYRNKLKEYRKKLKIGLEERS